MKQQVKIVGGIKVNTWKEIYWTENHERNKDIENKILELYEENNFDFSDAMWSEIFTAGYNMLDVAKLCCKHAVLSEVECYDRHIVVGWNNDDIKENDVLKILDKAYDQWVHIDENPEVESYCCEEWMLHNLNKIYNCGFFVLYCKNAIDISDDCVFYTY